MKRFWIDGVCSDSANVAVPIPCDGGVSCVMVDEAGGLAVLSVIAPPGANGKVLLSLAGNVDDVMEIREPRRITFGVDGVILSVLDYVQLGGAMTAIPEMLTTIAAKVTELERQVSELTCNQTSGTSPSGPANVLDFGNTVGDDHPGEE
jgi:hypothetical protein